MSQILKPKKGYKKVKGLFGKYEEIPEEWKLAYLEKILDITMGMSPPSESYNEDKIGLPFYQGVTDFGNIYPKSTVWCSEPRKIAEKNQILFSVRAPVGEINITEEQSCLGRGVCSLDSLDNDLMYCYFLISFNKKRFSVYAQGTTYDAINRNEIAKTKLPFTSNNKEQQKIASILSNVDNLIISTQKIINQTISLKKGLIHKLLVRGIGHTKFKKVKWLFGKEIEIPEEWNFDNVKHVSTKLIVGFVGTCEAFYTDNKGIPMLRTTNVNEGKLELSNLKYVTREFHEKNKKSQVKENDLLVSRHGENGEACLVRNLQESNCLNIVIIQPKQDQFIPQFFELAFNSPIVRKQIRRTTAGGVQDVVNTSEIGKVNIVIPPLPEQQKIATILSNVDSQITTQTQYKEKLERLKKSLMQKLLTGQVRVAI